MCNEYYQLSKGEIWLPDGLELNHYLKSFAVMFVMGSTVFSAYFLVRIYDYGYTRTISVGVATLIEYICLKILGVNLLSAYHKAKFAALIIKGKILDESGPQNILRESSTSNDNLSTAHLSSTGDDYSNESDSLTGPNDVELRTGIVQPYSSRTTDQQSFDLDQYSYSDKHQHVITNSQLNSSFNQQSSFLNRQSTSDQQSFANQQHSADVICFTFLNDDCLEQEKIESI